MFVFDIAVLLPGSCPPGTFLNATNRDCKQCEKGTFKSDVYAEACTKCPQDTTTMELGSKNISDCIGTYDEILGGTFL